MTRIAYLVAALSLSLAATACRGGDDSGDDGGGDDGSGSGSSDGGSNAGVVTVKQIQNDAMPAGTQVEVKSRVVLAIDTYGDRTGDFWVGDPEGGEFSGVKVFGGPLDVVATLKAGDLVDIANAVKDEFALDAEPSDRRVTEIGPVGDGDLLITKIGTGTLPTPSTVDALAISMKATEEERFAEWEKWEGVLIKVINARQFNAVSTFGAGGQDQLKFTITGGAIVETVLAPFNSAAAPGTCFAGITGIGDYFFDYLVLPTADTSTVGGGSGCSALTMATIPAIQAGTTLGDVVLTDVYVTAVSSNRKNYWVASSLTAAANEGLSVFRCSSAMSCMTATELPADITPGAKISLLGKAVEFNNMDNGGGMTGTTLTQLTNSTITAKTAAVTPPTGVTGLTVTNLLADATGEPYEGVLVTLANVKVTAVAPNAMSPSFGISDFAQYPANVAFKADDDLFLMPTTSVDACYATVTGIWHYSAFDNRYLFLPTGVGAGAGICTP